jgi:hypothetical protein
MLEYWCLRTPVRVTDRVEYLMDMQWAGFGGYGLILVGTALLAGALLVRHFRGRGNGPQWIDFAFATFYVALGVGLQFVGTAPMVIAFVLAIVVLALGTLLRGVAGHIGSAFASATYMMVIAAITLYNLRGVSGSLGDMSYSMLRIAGLGAAISVAMIVIDLARGVNYQLRPQPIPRHEEITGKPVLR